MEPTICQKKALATTAGFLGNPKGKAMILTGAAGTGKTALTKWIVDLAEFEGFQIQLLAYTVSASNNIRKKVLRATSTIHAYIYEVVTEDGVEVCHRKEIDERGKCLYIVDEASLIPSKKSGGKFATPSSVLEDLIDHCQLESSEGKILFVGDSNQLPPVKEDFARALHVPSIQRLVKSEVSNVQLTQVMRQDSSSKAFQASQICLQAIENNFAYSDPMRFDNPLGLEQLKDKQRGVVVRNIAEAFDMESLEIPTVALAPGHKQVSWVNQAVRASLGRPNHLLVPGDHMTIKETLYAGGAKVARGVDVLIVEAKERSWNWAGASFQEVKIRYASDILMLEAWTLANLTFAFEEREELQEEIEKTLVAEAMAKNPRYRASKDKRDDKYLSAARMRFRYAMTVHQSQGREFQDVFVNPHWFSFGTSRFKHQYMYVAVTRARNEAKLFQLYLPKAG